MASVEFQAAADSEARPWVDHAGHGQLQPWIDCQLAMFQGNMSPMFRIPWSNVESAHKL